MEFSTFGAKFNRYSGITQVMDDLNAGMSTPGTVMLGGGNPAVIPAAIEYFQQVSEEMLQSGELVRAMTKYDGPQGKSSFITVLVMLFKNNYGWNISAKNICLTNGSQSSFFYLFNLFAGKQPDGSCKKVLLPLAPEYVGYGDVTVDEDIFVSCAPNIEYLANRQFKYHIDFEQLHIDDSVAAICASRPTNPTGNVLTDEEVAKLDELARANNIPLILDNAYGLPFPNIIFADVKPFWNDNTILCMSLSKLGLPGVRCGIVIANEDVIQSLTNLNGIISLAPCSVGPAVAQHILQKGDLLNLSNEVIQPYYQQKSQRTVEQLLTAIPDKRFRIHKPEGAIFLWLWFDELPIATTELYQRLKQRGVLVVPGEYFFLGQEQDTPHSHQCIRMNYVQDDELMQKGIHIIAEEVNRAYQQG